MAIATLTPASQGTDDVWDLGAGASKTVAVQTNDGDTSYIKDDDPGGQHTFYHSQLTPDAVEIVTHTLYHRSRTGTGGAQFLRDSGRLKYGANTTIGVCKTGLTDSYSLENDADLAVPGGGTWSRTIVNATQIGIGTCNTGAGGEVRCTQLYWDVEFEPAAGVFVYLVSQWLAPLLGLCGGAGLVFREIGAALKAIQAARLSAMPILPSTPREFEMTKNGLLVRRRYCFAD